MAVFDQELLSLENPHVSLGMWALNRLAYIDYTIRELESLPEKDRAIREHISFCKKRRVFYMQLQRMQEDG